MLTLKQYEVINMTCKGEKDKKSSTINLNYNAVENFSETNKGLGKFRSIIKFLSTNLYKHFLIVNVFVSVYLVSEFGLIGIVYSALITSALLLILNIRTYIYLVNEGFKVLWGKYPFEIKKGEKLRKIKIVWGSKNDKTKPK